MLGFAIISALLEFEISLTVPKQLNFSVPLSSLLLWNHLETKRNIAVIQIETKTFPKTLAIPNSLIWISTQQCLGARTLPAASRRLHQFRQQRQLESRVVPLPAERRQRPLLLLRQPGYNVNSSGFQNFGKNEGNKRTRSCSG